MTIKKTRICSLLICLFVLILLILTACQSEEVPEVDAPTPTPTLPPAQKAIRDQWEGSPHSDTYALEKGPNTYCAKCHSPTNWDYAATIDAPPNCVSCKFPFEPEPRIAENNPLVPEEEWGNIGCEVCHQMNGRVAEPEYFWFDNAAGYYEVVGSTTELCEKCHKNNENFLQHQRNMGTQVHQGYFCTDCHDPHDPYVSCGSKDCHSDIISMRTLATENHLNLSDREQCLECHTNGMDTHSIEPVRSGEKDCLVCHDYYANVPADDLAPVYHSQVHKNLECVACHDATGLEVGQIEGEDTWITFRTLESPFGVNTEPYQSHNLQLGGDCSRCHYVNNPWDLPDSIDGSE